MPLPALRQRQLQNFWGEYRTRAPTPSCPRRPPRLKSYAQTSATTKKVVRGHNRKVPPHHVIKQPHPKQNTMSADAGCCDASPWMSWNWWWEPIRGYTRQRSQAEQEMIEACTTPRSGRTSFDE